VHRYRGKKASAARASLAIVAVLGVLAIGACGSPKLTTSSARCTPTADPVLQSIAQKLQVPGVLRNSRTVNRSGTNYVSAELHRPADKPDTKGDLLTWATASAADGGAGFVAVDVRARANSSWPHAPFDVRSAGAMLSRACADEIRGQVPCPGHANAVTVPSGFGGHRDRCAGAGS
jgi:hypothetical protein